MAADSHVAEGGGTVLSYPASIVHAVEHLLRSQPDIKVLLYDELKPLYAAAGSSSSSSSSLHLTPHDDALINEQIDMYYLPMFAYLKSLCDAKLQTVLQPQQQQQQGDLSPSPLTATTTGAFVGEYSDGNGGSSRRIASDPNPNPMYVGISAPQGCGKTTMTDIMVRLFARQGIHAIALSLDDFYLRGAGKLSIYSRLTC
jgi:hypothetical protein